MGRDGELRTLLDLCARARVDEGPVAATIVAEPGIGQSHLLAELLQRAPLPTPSGAGYELARDVPFSTASELLRELARVPGEGEALDASCSGRPGPPAGPSRCASSRPPSGASPREEHGCCSWTTCSGRTASPSRSSTTSCGRAWARRSRSRWSAAGAPRRRRADSRSSSIERPRPTASDELFVGDSIRGGASTVYEVDPLAAGTYSFVCTSHSNMRGAFIVSAT